MDLTILVMTINGRDNLPRILPGLHGIGGELVIGIDDTTLDDSAAIARQYTDKVYPVRHAGFCGGGKPDHPNSVQDMLPHCSGDWVFRIDHDETLSPLWSDPRYLSSLLHDRYATHYWIPRRWVLPPGDRFISNRVWHPAYQLRLFRNVPSLIRFNRLAHEPPVIAGESRKLTRAWINHWDFVWHDRSAREAKVLFYKGFSPYTGEEVYLYEGCDYQTKPLDYIPARPQLAEAANSLDPFAITIRALDAPDRMYACETDSIFIQLSNYSERILRPASNMVRPATVLLSYHWYRAGTPPVLYEWDGERRNLPGPLAPGESVEDFLVVKTPREPGDYFLQPDLVEESVMWYSAHNSFPSLPIAVMDGR